MDETKSAGGLMGLVDTVIDLIGLLPIFIQYVIYALMISGVFMMLRIGYDRLLQKSGKNSVITMHPVTGGIAPLSPDGQYDPAPQGPRPLLSAQPVDMDMFRQQFMTACHTRYPDASASELTEAWQTYRTLYEGLSEEWKSGPGPQDLEGYIALRQGKMDEVTTIMRAAIAKEDINAAARHYRTGVALLMMMSYEEALHHLDKACHLQPNNHTYGFTYAKALLDQKQFAQAEAIYTHLLPVAREMAAQDPKLHRPLVATTLNHLANLYIVTQRFGKAETALQETLHIYRGLALEDSTKYQPDVATSLINLANLLQMTSRLADAEMVTQEALNTYRALARARPNLYRPRIAETLDRLANLYRDAAAWPEALAACRESVVITSDLAKTAPNDYQPMQALRLQNFGNLCSETGALHEAGDAYRNAVQIYRQLAERDTAHRADLVITLNNLSAIYQELAQPIEAAAAANEAQDLIYEMSAIT